MGILEQFAYDYYPGEWLIGFWVLGFYWLAKYVADKSKILGIVFWVVAFLPVIALILFYLLPFAVIFLAPLGVLWLLSMIVINLYDLQQKKKGKDELDKDGVK